MERHALRDDQFARIENCFPAVLARSVATAIVVIGFSLTR